MDQPKRITDEAYKRICEDAPRRLREIADRFGRDEELNEFYRKCAEEEAEMTADGWGDVFTPTRIKDTLL